MANRRSVQVVADRRRELEVDDRGDHFIETQDHHDGEEVPRAENQPRPLSKRVSVARLILTSNFLFRFEPKASCRQESNDDNPTCDEQADPHPLAVAVRFQACPHESGTDGPPQNTPEYDQAV